MSDQRAGGSRSVGRPPGSGYVQDGLTNMPPGEFTIREAAAAIGSTYMVTAHTAANLTREGYLVRVRRGVYRHLTPEEWDARLANDLRNRATYMRQVAQLKIKEAEAIEQAATDADCEAERYAKYQPKETTPDA